jgi:hypothetical protein
MMIIFSNKNVWWLEQKKNMMKKIKKIKNVWDVWKKKYVDECKQNVYDYIVIDESWM